jgi:diguanylate cyclase (GGDEF)-like protein/PAS domain S-box-containing protein
MRIDHRSFGLYLIAAVVYAVVAYATILMSRAFEDVAEIWLANAILLGMMVHRERKHFPVMLLAGAVGSLVADLIARQAPQQALVYTIASMTEVATAYGMLQWLRIRQSSAPSERDFFLGVPAVVLAAPAFSGSIAAMWAVYQGKSDFLPAFMNWWTAGVLGMLAALPVVWTASRDGLRQLVRGARAAEFWLWLLAVMAVAAAATFYLPRPFAVVMLPLLMAAYRLGVFRSCLINLAAVTAVIAAAVAVRHVWTWAPGYQNIELLGIGQLGLYSALSITGPLLVSIVVARREQTAQALARANRDLEVVSDNMPALIGEIDARRRYRFVNRAYELLYGRPREQILGRTARELLGEHYNDVMDRHIESALAGETVRFELTSSTGREVEVAYIPHAEGGATEGFFALGLDITDRKAAERALFAEKERAQITLDSIGDAVVVCDNEMRLTLLNPIAEDMTGWTLEEAIGRPVHEVVKLVGIASGESPLSPLAIAIRDNRTVALQTETALERRDGYRSAIEDTAAPMHDRDGNVTGAVMVFHDVSETRAMALKMSHLAQHDALTDLPNRVLFRDRLAQAIAMVGQGMEGAVLFVDLDHFKHINDSLGHQAGDEVLQEVARRLTASVRTDDTVSRQGGDEFVLMLHRLADPRDAARVAQKLIAAIEQPFLVGDKALHFSASVGIALFPQDSRDLETLMKQADTALYHAKHSGRGRFSYFTESMSARADERLRIERELRDALVNDELFLVFQPRVSASDGRITGMEALLRWRMRDGTVATPDRFIPIAEEVGLIVQIDEWAMREACRRNAQWQRIGLSALPVAVNVSLARFEPERLAGHVRKVLEETGLAAHHLEIEFTESQMFKYEEQTRELLALLKTLGVRIAIDDFGTGYSNLNYLVQYHFDTLKIDRSFVGGLPNDSKCSAVVQAVIGLAQALHYDVVAEGVETAEQAKTLARYGCRHMQGYLYARPVPADEFAELLRRGNVGVVVAADESSLQHA